MPKKGLYSFVARYRSVSLLPSNKVKFPKHRRLDGTRIWQFWENRRFLKIAPAALFGRKEGVK